MKKIIRSTGLYCEDTPSPVPIQTVEPRSATAEQSSVVRKRSATVNVRWRPVCAADDYYTEDYERECIAWEAAGCPDLASSRLAMTFLSAEAGFIQPRVIEGLEAAKLQQRYRMDNRRSSIALVPLHRGTTWRILEHADGTHTAFNADFGGHSGLL